MKQTRKLYPVIYFALTALFLQSCIKEELPIDPHVQGEFLTNQVEMGDDYGTQIWFDLETNSVVKSSPKTDWDIAFSCEQGNHMILQNTALLSRAAITEFSNLDEVNSSNIADLHFKTDHHSGISDSLALGDWVEHQKVCVIDRGYDEGGNNLGFIKIQFLSLQNETYTFRYAEIDESEFHEVSLEKNTIYNHLAYSFTTHQMIVAEPPKDNWDICFTQYVHAFYDPYTPYLVTGVLINSQKVSVARTTGSAFPELTLSEAQNLTFSKSQDAIGYEWKYYDFDSGLYTVDATQIYIIKSDLGVFYKLHFIDFYNDQGEKGAPEFEFVSL